MQAKQRILMILASMLMLGIILLPTMVMAQGDTQPTPTPIGVVGEEEDDDSGAPTAPDIAPPTVEGQELPSTSEEDTETGDPEATEAVGADDATTGDAITDAIATCPVAVQDAFTATEILCTDISAGEACIGNGTVDSVFGGDIAGLNFNQANDRVRLTSLDQITLISGSTWTVVRAGLELASTDGGIITNGTMFAYGNVTLVDTGATASGGAQAGTVVAGRGLNVRRTAGNEGVVVWQLQGGQQVTVTGISADEQWIRIVIPNEFAGTGWVYAPYITVEGGSETLPIVADNSINPDLSPPEFAPGQSFELLSANSALECVDVPDSGLLVQSPSGTPDAMRLEINGVELQINGTVFIQAQADGQLRASVLEGQTVIIANDATVSATVNNRLSIGLDGNLTAIGTPEVSPITAEELPGIPIRLLPRQIAFGIAPVAVAEQPETESTGFGTPQPTEEAPPTQACTLTAPDEVRNIRAGASTEFEVVRVLQPNESVTAVGQAIGELNLTWYQTDTGGWIRIDTVNVSGDCASLPQVEPPILPTPTPETESEDESESASVGDGSPSLSSSTLPELVCDGTAITGSATSDGTNLSVAIGGTWTASAGTSVTFTTNGGMLRPEFGDYIQLVTADGNVIAGSDEGRSITVTLENDVTFEARFSAGNGDTVVMAASCG